MVAPGWRTELFVERLGTVLLAAATERHHLGNGEGKGRKLLALATHRTNGVHQLLMQSVIFGWVFYGYGLGLFGKLV